MGERRRSLGKPASPSQPARDLEFWLSRRLPPPPRKGEGEGVVRKRRVEDVWTADAPSARDIRAVVAKGTARSPWRRLACSPNLPLGFPRRPAKAADPPG